MQYLSLGGYYKIFNSLQDDSIAVHKCNTYLLFVFMYYIGDYVLANTWSLKKYRSIIYLLTMWNTFYIYFKKYFSQLCHITLYPPFSKNVSAILSDHISFDGENKVIHPKYYKHLKKDAHQSHLGRQKMGWFWAD